MVAFAMVYDLAARWRPLSASEELTATALLADASTVIRSEAPGIDAQIAADPPTLDPDIPVMVACRMVKRAMASGPDVDGVTTQQQSAGSLSLSLTYANPTGDLYLTKVERRMLGVGRPRAFSIDLAPDAGMV